MKSVVSDERNPENDAPSPPAAVEMGNLQLQPSSGPLEPIEQGQKITVNPQQPPHAQTNKNRSSSLQSDLSQHREPAKQPSGPSESQDHGKSRISGHAEADKSKEDDLKLQPAGSAAGKHAPTRTDGPALPAIRIILLLPTGARHNLHITETYLKEQNISVAAKDPFAISVYTLKELILRDWHEGISNLIPCS